MIARRRGQVLLEFAISLFGLVAFIYVILKTWGWMTGMIPQRQASFQQTRLAAGSSNPGQPVPYQRPNIRLIGPDSAPPGQITGWVPPEPPLLGNGCPAAQDLLNQAQTLIVEGTDLMEEVYRREPIRQKGVELSEVQARIEQLEEVEIPAAQAVVDDLNAQIAAVDAQIAALGSQYCSTTCDEFGCSEWCDPRYYEEVAPLEAERIRLTAELAAAQEVLDSKNAELAAKKARRQALGAELRDCFQRVQPLIDQAQAKFNQAEALWQQVRQICFGE